MKRRCSRSAGSWITGMTIVSPAYCSTVWIHAGKKNRRRSGGPVPFLSWERSRTGRNWRSRHGIWACISRRKMRRSPNGSAGWLTFWNSMRMWTGSWRSRGVRQHGRPWKNRGSPCRKRAFRSVWRSPGMRHFPSATKRMKNCCSEWERS